LKKILQLALLLLLIFAVGIFTLTIKKEDKKPIKIEPIKIESPSVKQELSFKEVKKEEPVDILSKLKVATKVSTEGIVPSNEEVSNRVLESLKKSIAKQKVEEPATIKPIEKKVVPKKKIVKKLAAKRVHKKRVVAKKVKVIKKVKSVKKVQIAKKHRAIAKKKTKKIAKVLKRREVIANTQKGKTQPTLNEIQAVATPTPMQRGGSHLTREEEVALYHKKYASDLEIVNVSKPFVIKEEKILPDSHYFESQKPVETTPNTNPTKFVQTLGVVAVSNAYETPLVVPKKIEVAKEGIVEFKNAKLETEEMKRLKFVKPLEVVEVSKPFETIEAEKYLK